MMVAGLVLAQGCQLFSQPSRGARVVNSLELCKLSLEELLRLTVLEVSNPYQPRLLLIDLPLDDLLTIEAVRPSRGTTME